MHMQMVSAVQSSAAQRRAVRDMCALAGAAATATATVTANGKSNSNSSRNISSNCNILCRNGCCSCTASCWSVDVRVEMRGCLSSGCRRTVCPCLISLAAVRFRLSASACGSDVEQQPSLASDLHLSLSHTTHPHNAPLSKTLNPSNVGLTRVVPSCLSSSAKPSCCLARPS